jgi:hypothetical protein
MSDGMAFLTGAAFAGVAVLFMLKGGGNIGAAITPSPQPLPYSQTNPVNPINPASPTNPYNPYGTTPPTPYPAASPGSAFYNNYEQQRLDSERLKVILDQQRTETEQLKAQLQNQQLLIEKLSTQNDPNNSLFTRSKPASAVAAQQQQQDNPLFSGIVWALGGVAVTISGGVVVIGALSVLSRQQRPPRTTYVVQQPYNALPHTLQPRRRTEVMPPQLDDRRVDYVEYDR